MENTSIKDFFTESQWDLIHNLIMLGIEVCEEDEETDQELIDDYDSIAEKIQTLFEDHDS